MFCSIFKHVSTWSFGKEITTKEANCLRKKSFGILEIAFFNKISLPWQDKRMKVFFKIMNLSSPGVREIWLKFKKQSKEPNKEQSRAAEKKLALEFNMNIIFSSNVSNNNADGCFKLHKYTEVYFFICTNMGNYSLITGIAIRVSVSLQ